MNLEIPIKSSRLARIACATAGGLVAIMLLTGSHQQSPPHARIQGHQVEVGDAVIKDGRASMTLTVADSGNAPLANVTARIYRYTGSGPVGTVYPATGGEVSITINNYADVRNLSSDDCTVMDSWGGGPQDLVFGNLAPGESQTCHIDYDASGPATNGNVKVFADSQVAPGFTVPTEMNTSDGSRTNFREIGSGN